MQTLVTNIVTKGTADMHQKTPMFAFNTHHLQSNHQASEEKHKKCENRRINKYLRANNVRRVLNFWRVRK